jgi:deoxycytidylate deaminase
VARSLQLAIINIATRRLEIENNVFYKPGVYTTHAEVDCIRKIKKKNIFKEAILIVVKITGYTSCPCDPCKKVIRKTGIKKVYYKVVGRNK